MISFVSYTQTDSKSKSLNDSLIHKKINEEFELNFHNFLDGNKWFLESIDTTEIKLISKTSKSPEFISDTLRKAGLVMIGGGFTEIWKFVGLQKGVYKLRFYYGRPHQNDRRRIKNVKVIIS
ncbi:MAG: protease inhibitor I42 family protein [Bacteroidales bacterium]|jgi:hypothetical protein|nr:protease inhibitor I42 family protein [Bacteroidales bacterium]